MDWVREALCGVDSNGEPIGGRDLLTGERLVPSLLQPYLLSRPVANSVLVLDNAPSTMARTSSTWSSRPAP